MQKKLRVILLMVVTLLLLSGCSQKETVEVTEPQYPTGAIFPVMADEEKGIKAREIILDDFTLQLPNGYVYGKVDYGKDTEIPYTTYYVWKDKADKEYSLELDNDILFYVYEGTDTNSPHQALEQMQAKISIRTGYLNYFFNLVSLEKGMFDGDVVESSDRKNFVFSFTGNSGESITTTSGDILYPKTYYGIYTLEKERRNDSNRKFYAFIFSNDAEGEIFKKSEYDNLIGQIKRNFSISEFYNGSALIDFTHGKTYEHLTDEVIYKNEQSNYIEHGIFHNTLLYYVETLGRDYDRKNVDSSKTENPRETEIIEKKDDKPIKLTDKESKREEIL